MVKPRRLQMHKTQPDSMSNKSSFYLAGCVICAQTPMMGSIDHLVFPRWLPFLLKCPSGPSRAITAPSLCDIPVE